MERLDDLSARHASHLHRYSSYTVNQIIKILAKADARITLRILDLTDGMTQKEINEFLSGHYSTRRLIQLKESINELAHETRQTVSTIMGSNGKDLAGYEVKYTTNILEAISTTVAEATIGATVTTSQAYAAAMSRPLLGRHIRDMVKDLEPDFRRKLSAEIRESYLMGESSSTLVRRIRGTAEQNRVDGLLFRRNRAIETLVRTANTHISNIAAEASYKANGVEQVMYRATLDGNTTHICANLDGNVYPIGKGPRPPQHYGCRSSTLAYFEGMEVDWDRPSVADKRPVSKIPKGERKDVIKRVPASKNFKQWFEGTDKKFKKQWLGRDRYKLYKEGVPFERFSDPRGKKYTLQMLEIQDNKAFKAAGLKSRKAT